MRYTITSFGQGTCEKTGKDGEVVTVDSPDEAIEGARLSWKALEEMVRFRHLQERKKSSDDDELNILSA